MSLPFTLITLTGEELHVYVDQSARTSFQEFENAILEQLPMLGRSSTFGCELQFVQIGTQTVLTDPVQQQLSAKQCLYVIAGRCFVEAMYKGSLIGEEKAIRVPFVKQNRVPPQAFSYHTEVRHALVEEGFRIVGEAAWRSCHRLQIVHLPDTVVSLRHGAFRKWYMLREVTAPGCRHFGIKVFEQCSSLTQIGNTWHSDNLLAPQAQFRPRAFEGCTALRHLNLGKAFELSSGAME